MGAAARMTTELVRPLTPRQHDVARLVARGLGTTEIAVELKISFDAARSHVNAIADKLDNPRLLTPLRLVRQWAARQEELRTESQP